MKGTSAFKYIRLMVTIPFLFSVLITGNALCFPCSEEPANGATKGEVASKCGEPMIKDERSIKVEETYEEGEVVETSKEITEWTYRSGPDNLVQLFHFEDGHLVQIKNVGYGKVNDFTNDMCRDGESLRVGDTLAEAILKCGEPLAKETRDARIVETEIPGKIRRTFVPVVEWTYRYGPDAPGYTVTFENGVAVNIRTREFGK